MRLAGVLAVVLILALVVVIMVACESPAAQRERAEAAKIQAEAVAYQQRAKADTEAAADRANVRQMERDAAHQRALEVLPFLAVIVGAVLLAGLGGLVFWDLRRQSQAAPSDTGLLFFLERQHLDQAARDRDLWRAIAQLDRRRLETGDQSQEVIICDNR